MPTDPRPDFTPDWPICAADGCRGIQVDGTNCLSHSPAWEEFLADLHPGANLDLRGTILSSEMVHRIVERFRAQDGWTHYGIVTLSRVWFTGDAGFGLAIFNGYARFDSACFSGSARFLNVRFEDGVNFGQARFNAADLQISVIEVAHFLLAQFSERAVLEVEAPQLELMEARFTKGMTLRLLGGALDATGTVFGEPSSIIGKAAEVVSLRDVDVQGLVVTDLSLRHCSFAGARGLDQLRLDGNSRFEWRRPRWWLTRRQMLAEEAALRGWGDLPQDEYIGPARVAGSIGRCGNPLRTARTRLVRATSTTARWKCGAIPRKPRARRRPSCGSTGCSPDTGSGLPAPLPPSS